MSYRALFMLLCRKSHSSLTLSKKKMTGMWKNNNKPRQENTTYPKTFLSEYTVLRLSQYYTSSHDSRRVVFKRNYWSKTD